MHKSIFRLIILTYIVLALCASAYLTSREVSKNNEPKKQVSKELVLVTAEILQNDRNSVPATFSVLFPNANAPISDRILQSSRSLSGEQLITYLESLLPLYHDARTPSPAILGMFVISSLISCTIATGLAYFTRLLWNLSDITTNFD